jgi:multidrug resistance efflux pump
MKLCIRLWFRPLLAALAFCLALPGSGRAMELGGRIEHPRSMEVHNPYAGSCVEVRAHVGDAVAAGDVLAVYRLDQKAHDEIEQAVSERDLRLRQSELRLLEAQRREIAAKRDQLQEAVAAGVESRARLDAADDDVALLDQQISGARADIQEIAARLREDRARYGEELGLPLSGEHVPWEANLRAPMDGVVAEQKLAPRLEMARNRLCFRVASLVFHVACKVGADDYAKLKAGDTGRVTIQGLPGEVFEAVLLTLPLTAEDKGLDAAAAYEVEFLIRGLDRFVSEGVRVKVLLDK